MYAFELSGLLSFHLAKRDDFSESNIKDALRFATLCQIIAKLDLANPVHLLQATILAFGQNMSLRTAESTSGIKARQLTFRVSSRHVGISLVLLRTKTYRSGSGCIINIDDFGHPFSAVNLLQRWWLLNDFKSTPDAFVFPAIVRNRIVYSTPMNGDFLRHIIKSAVKDIGLDPTRYSGHSLRAGGATDLFAARIPYWVIKKMGRWKSDAALRYYRSEEDVVNSVRKAFKRLSTSAV